jgi:hypothetical protein
VKRTSHKKKRTSNKKKAPQRKLNLSDPFGLADKLRAMSTWDRLGLILAAIFTPGMRVDVAWEMPPQQPAGEKGQE